MSNLVWRLRVAVALFSVSLVASSCQAPLLGSSASSFSVKGWYVDKDKHSPRDKVIVFVHGVLSSGRAAWLNEKTGISWPELMRRDRALHDKYDVFVVSYDSPAVTKAQDIVDVAVELNKRLTENKILGSSREIIFLGHSMGNLVIRTALMIDPAYYDADVPLLLSIASPSNGSTIANMAHRFSRNPHFVALDAIAHNPFLQLLNSFWLNSRPWDVEIACAYETRPTPPLAQFVVDRVSAMAVCSRLDQDDVGEMAEDHISIVKPANTTSKIHAWATREILLPRKFPSKHPDRWNERRIVIGGKDFLESNILAAMMALAINPDFRAGCSTTPRAAPDCIDITMDYHIGGRDQTFEKLATGRVDIYPEYTGTLLANMPDVPFEMSRDSANHAAVAMNKLFAEKRDWKRFVVHPEFGFQNSYQLIMRRDKAEELGISVEPNHAKISDLEGLCPSARSDKKADRPCPLRFKSSPDFFYRADGVRGLRERYRFEFRSIDYTLHQNIYADLARKAMDVTDGWTTDPLIRDKTQQLFIKLVDDKKFFPPYYAVGLANRKLFETFPHLRTALDRLQGRITEAEISELIGRVKQAAIASEELGFPSKAEGFEVIVRAFMEEKQLIPKSRPRPESRSRQ